MPCRQVSTYNGTTGSGKAGGGGYATEADCNQACKEGACCEGTTCSVKPQCQCQGTGKTFKGVGTTCSSGACGLDCPQVIPESDFPASLTMRFNQKPSAKAHGCIQSLAFNTTTLDSTGSITEWLDVNTNQYGQVPGVYGRVKAKPDWTPLDVFSDNLWSDSVVLTRQRTLPGGVYPPDGAVALYSNNLNLFGGNLDKSVFAGAWIGCKYVSSDTGKVVWQIVQARALLVASLTVTSTFYNIYRIADPYFRAPNGHSMWYANATVGGDSAVGFSISTATSEYSQYESTAPIYIPCNELASSVISSVSMTFADNPLP